MKIHLLDLDSRFNSDPNYFSNMGSFGIVIHGLNSGLKELGYYSEADSADWVGTIEGVGIGFKYKDKKSFVINVWDMINVLPNELLIIQKQINQRMFGLSNQVTNLWKKYGVNAQTVMPGIDVGFYKQNVSKSKKFTFLFDSFGNVRSGFDLAMHAFLTAFNDIKSQVKMVVKNTTDSKKFIDMVKLYQNYGLDIELINKRITFDEMRNLYSRCHVSLNVMRHSSWGLNIQMAAACGCLPIVGDFCPSNEMDVGILLKPDCEIFISDSINHLVNNWGLHNAYGSFTYFEPPRFYSYSAFEYARLLRDVYDNWDNKYSKIDNRKSLLADKWTWKNSAQNLVNYLKQ